MQKDEPTFISLMDFDTAARKICPLTVTQVLKLHPLEDRSPKERKLLCFDLIYISELLQHGYGRAKEDVLHAGKSIELNGHPIETQWPLGAALLIV